MKGIPLTAAQFDSLEPVIHSELKIKLKGYKKNTTAWAKKELVPFNKTTGKYLFPVSKGKRWGMIKKKLTSAQIGKIIEVLPNDPNWFDAGTD